MLEVRRVRLASADRVCDLQAQIPFMLLINHQRFSTVYIMTPRHLIVGSSNLNRLQMVRVHVGVIDLTTLVPLENVIRHLIVLRSLVTIILFISILGMI